MERQLAGAAVGAVVSSFVRPLADEAARLAKEKIALLWGVDEEIEKLSETLTSIRSVLACAEQREPADERVGTWLARLRDVAIDADDVLDEFATEAAIRRPSGSMQPLAAGRGGRRRRGCLSSCFPCVHTVTFRHEIGYRIKDIREKLGAIDGDHRQLGLVDVGGGTSSVATATEARETTSMVEDINVTFVGRGKEKEEIIHKLLGRAVGTEEPQISSAGHHGDDVAIAVPLLPIVGMGGIGKTALAQAIFNEKRVVNSFPFRQWVHVGEKFEPKRIIKLIVGASDSTSTLEDLQSCLLQKLRKEGFLIILDDVWSEDYGQWKQILPPLMQGGGKEGGAVVFTTRSHKVAAAAGANTEGASLMGLPEEDCWQIFEKRAFGVGGSSAATHSDLRNVGREIVKKLNGVPLAVMAVAGFLRETPEESRWMNVLASISWPLSQGVLPVLKLSYHHLPPPLKQCFAYCSVFPKDYVFDRSKLVQMWIAQSYIPPQVGMRLEDKAGIYFDDLHLRSFLQRVPHGDGYQMHDLMHDLARWVSNEESHIMGEDGSSAREPNKVFHVSLSNDSGVVEFQKLYEFQRARALLYLHDPSSSVTVLEIPRHLFDEHLRRIRVLCLSYCDVEELPDSVGELKHLRYLDLSFTKIGLLPKSICDLWNLQTLRILNSELTMVLVELPRGMSKLVNLRHLNLHQDLAGNIPGIGKLSSLQGLKVFYVGHEDGHRITELKDLVQLGGDLSIRNLENVESKDAAAQANLKNKLYIDELGLEWPGNWDANTRNVELEMEVLEGLQPPPNLRTLRVSNNGGLRHPAWMSGKLPHSLRSISLHGCRNWPCLPPLGCLPYLKVLEIGGAGGVKQVGHEVYGTVACRGVRAVFPALEELEIYDMVEWEAWEGVAAAAGEETTTALFPALRRLHIRNCPKLRGIPHLPPSLAELKLHEMGLRKLPEIPPCADHGAPRASSLSKLEIHLCPSLESIPTSLLRSLTSLMELEIRGCGELASVNLHSHHLRCLKNLTITDCPKLALEEKDEEEPCSSSLPPPPPSPATASSVLLPSLELLTSDNSSVLERLLQPEHTALQNLLIKNSSCVPGGLRGLRSLSILTLMECPQLQSLPELQHLSNLGRLWVQDCPQLQSLPLLRGLSQLTKLCVERCPKVQSLPEGELPTTVKHLLIKGCPGLKERCQREIGEDWPKIAHVPYKFIF